MLFHLLCTYTWLESFHETIYCLFSRWSAGNRSRMTTVRPYQLWRFINQFSRWSAGRQTRAGWPWSDITCTGGLLINELANPTFFSDRDLFWWITFLQYGLFEQSIWSSRGGMFAVESSIYICILWVKIFGLDVFPSYCCLAYYNLVLGWCRFLLFVWIRGSKLNLVS